MQLVNTVNDVVPSNAKWAFTTRRVDKADIAGLSRDFRNAVAGDLVLAQVTRIGSHTKTQLASGRPSLLASGDYIVLCCGDRYAPDQYEGRGIIDPDGCDMLAGGGLIGKVNVAHAKMSGPTGLKPIALLTDRHGDVINIAAYGVENRPAPPDMTVIAVVGASMNAGKTTATAALAHGLVKAGYRVAGIKATGTGAFGDFNALLDAGTPFVADFTDAGMPSTYLQPIDVIEQGLCALLASAREAGADIAVVELADGIYQQETAALLESSRVAREVFDGILFVSGDAVSVVGGIRHLRSIGLDPIAASGMISLSPLASSEAESVTGTRILKRDELMLAETASALAAPLVERRTNKCQQAA